MLQLSDVVVSQIQHLEDRELRDLLEGQQGDDPVVAQVECFQRLGHLSEAENLRNFVAREVERLNVLQFLKPAHRQNAV